MKKLVLALGILSSSALGISASLAEKPAAACKWSDVAKMKEHLSSHIKYPAKGSAVKEACRKEAPEEFTKEERVCFESKIKDATVYKSAEEISHVLGIE
jgi:hypothetical protein